VAAVAVLVLLGYRAANGSNAGQAAWPFLESDTTETTVTRTPTSATPASTTSVVPARIHVDFGFGTVVIDGHIMCDHEDAVNGDSITAVATAVAVDNADPAHGGPTAFASDPAAQAEIVRASVQVLGSANRFYAHCHPVGAGSTAPSAGGTTPLPASR
jgi:hypothetical protein